ncbi:MAG: hypothetical protein WBY44_10565 [Bryobacteraceae bacterium]|jgi:hypothetical protein
MKRLLALATMCAAGYAQLPSGSLWRDPGDVTRLDFGGSVGAPVDKPKPPLTFLREDMSGTQTKLFVKDVNGATWNVKFGYEVRPESFCWRVVRACGYFAEPSFFVPSGKIVGFQKLKRKDPSLHEDGSFTDARFQYRDPDLTFLNDKDWLFDGAPYGGTRELSGLKILIMLFSNWDNKDARVGAGGPNTAIFELKKPYGTRFIYAFTDWGAGFGNDSGPRERSIWRCGPFLEQSADWVERTAKGTLVFRYNGNISEGFRTGIPAAHAAWFMKYLGAITDAQLHAGFAASGANEADAACFTKALRQRIDELRAAAGNGTN